MNNTTIASIDLTKILFLDIETVPQHVSVSELSEAELALWNKKSQRLREEDMSDEDLYKKAGIFAEFGKIVCISVAYMRKVSNEYELPAVSCRLVVVLAVAVTPVSADLALIAVAIDSAESYWATSMSSDPR